MILHCLGADKSANELWVSPENETKIITEMNGMKYNRKRNSGSAIFFAAYSRIHARSLFANSTVFFSRFYPGRVKFDASISAAHSFGTTEIRSKDPNHTGRATRLEAQNICIPVDSVHSGHRIPKPINHQIENRFESLRQRFSWFIRFWQVWVRFRIYISTHCCFIFRVCLFIVRFRIKYFLTDAPCSNKEI